MSLTPPIPSPKSKQTHQRLTPYPTTGNPQLRRLQGRAREGQVPGHRAGRKDHKRVLAHQGLHVRSFTHVLTTSLLCSLLCSHPLLEQDQILIPHHSAEFPEDKVHTLSTNEHVTVEADSEVKTQ